MKKENEIIEMANEELKNKLNDIRVCLSRIQPIAQSGFVDATIEHIFIDLEKIQSILEVA